MKDRPLQKICS